MDFEQKLWHLANISGIPISCRDAIGEITHYPSMPYLQRIVMSIPRQYIETEKDVECLLTEDLLCFGMIREKEYARQLIIGPVKAIKCDNRRAQRILLRYGLPTTETGKLMTYLSGTPTYSLGRFAQFMVFCHYVINDDDIDVKEMLPQDYKYDDEGKSAVAKSDNQNEIEAHDAQDYEKALFSMVRFGQYEKMVGFMQNRPATVNEGSLADDLLRHQKNSVICSCAIVARCAVEGGVDYETAMSRADAYIQMVELAPNRSTLASLHKNMLLTYTKLVEEKKLHNANSAISMKVNNYVAERLTERITTDEIARALKVSRTHLSVQFKKDTGISLTEYITQLKLDEAMRLLLTTDQTAVHIAALLAFSSQSHFQTVFKKYVGMSPKEYRKGEHLL